MPLCERLNAADEERTNIDVSMKAWGRLLILKETAVYVSRESIYVRGSQVAKGT